MNHRWMVTGCVALVLCTGMGHGLAPAHPGVSRSSQDPPPTEVPRPRLREALRKSARLAVQLHREGGLVGIGSDFPIDGVVPGASVHRELELFVELGGATPLEALQIATLSSARILGFDELLGAVEPQRVANLVVFERNPLEDISNVRSVQYVIHDGRLLEVGAPQ